MRMFQKALIFLWQKIIFPQCCLICGKSAEDILCAKCRKQLKDKIKVAIENNNDKNKTYFEKHCYLFKYEDIRNLILDYKFNDKSYLYQIFSKIIIKNEKICGILKKYDIIIPVPIHKIRKNERGYNQSELIAKKIAGNIENLKYENQVVKKVIHNNMQSSLDKLSRKQNVKNVYKVINFEKIKNKKIVLFDDIYTTGNTANEISKILKENGAKQILVLTIAKD